MDSITIQRCIVSCDERMESCQAKVLRAMVRGLLTDDKGEAETMVNHSQSIEILKTEKLIYLSLLKTNNNRIFPLLYAKYCEQVTESLILGETWFDKQQDYLEYAKQIKKQMKYIEMICKYGELKK